MHDTKYHNYIYLRAVSTYFTFNRFFNDINQIFNV